MKDELSPELIGATITDDGVLTSYNGEAKEIEIPNSVKKILPFAFKNSKIEQVIINGNLGTIESYTFSSCEALRKVVIENGIVIISDNAFSNCPYLTSITIPSSVTKIDNNAFSGCDKLIEVINQSSLNIIAGSSEYGYVAYHAIEVHTGQSKIVKQNNYFFYTHNGVNYLVGYVGDETDLILPENYKGENYEIYNNAFRSCYSLTSVQIQSGITQISNCAFFDCENLTSITIPTSVTNIGNYAFGFCSKLTCIVVPNNVIKIGNFAFYDCTNLTSVIIPASVTSIGNYAFYGCINLTDITYRGDETRWSNITKGSNWHYNYKFLKINFSYRTISNTESDPIHFGFRLENNEYVITYYDKSENEIVIPTQYNNRPVTRIDDYAFYDCTNLTSVIIPASVTSIGNSAFEACTNLTSVTIPNSITNIGRDSFQYCYKLVEVINKSSLDIISGYSDYGGVAYYAIEVHTDESKIVKQNNYFFYTHNGVNYLVGYVGDETDLILPENYKGENYEIYDYAFYEYNNVISITIPESVTSIGYESFSNCYKLVEVINKSSLNIISGSSKYGYVAYYAIEVHTGESKIVNQNNYLFYTYSGVNYLVDYVGDSIDLTLPEKYNGENYEIYDYAFYEYNNVISITIPKSVTRIGYFAINDCDNLTTINYAGTESEWNNITKEYNCNLSAGSYTINYNYNDE